MTTTMVETFDTQMLDYQTDDYSMHVSSSDTWFHDEAIMEDDGLPIDDTNISIEVDMEPYDEDRNTEYEMVDESENHDLHSPELLDVEVYDASRATTPTIILTVDTPTLNTPTLLPTEVEGDSHLANGSEESEISLSESAPDPSSLLPLSELAEASVTNAHAEASDVVVSPSISPYPQPKEGLVNPPDAEFPDAHVDSALSSTNGQPEYDHSAATRPSEASTIATEQGHSVSNEQGTLIGDQVADSAQLDSEDQLGPAETTSVSATHQLTFHDHTQETGELGDYGSAVSSGDPHEISEGVFIDPPPPVLLSVAFIDHTEISLFNAPSLPETGSSTLKDHQSDIPVLLSHLPILYYEPLSSVFEALRQDDHFAKIGEYTNAELALNAYDLEMVLSEDNVYAREVSLHDLNVLHDGFNYSGPLRLRLQVAGPRFIVRYQALQEHVARLNISETRDGEADSSGDTSEVKQTHIQQEYKEELPESEVHEKSSVTDGSIQEQLQEVVHISDQGGTEVGTSHTASTAYDQDSDHTEDPESRQDYHEIDGTDHLETTEQQDISHEESSDHAGHDASDEEVDVGQVEDRDTHVGERHGVSEVAQDRENEETPEALYHTADTEERIADASNHKPKINAIQPSPALGKDQELPTQSNSHLHEDDYLKESDAGQPNLNSLPDLDSSEFDPHAENVSNDSKKEDHIASKEDVFVSLPGHENAEYDAETWDDDLDGEGEPDLLWEHEQETASNQSSVTLSSKTSSKRSISEAELGDNQEDPSSLPHSPGLKRTRVQ